MNEQAIKDAYDLFVQNGYTKSIDEFKKLMSTNENALNDSYGLFKENGYAKSIDDFKTLMGVSGAPTEDLKKKGQSATTVSPSAGTSLALPTGFPKPQDLPQGQGKPFEFNLDEKRPIPKEVPKNTIQKTMDWVTGVSSEAVKSVTEKVDDIINSSKNVLKEEGFFDENTPESNSTIFDFVKDKIGGAAQNLFLPGSVTAQQLVKKIINSSLSQEQKNKAIQYLNVASNKVKGVIKGVEDYQKETLPQGNIPTEVAKAITGFVPDLLLAEAIGPASTEAKLAKWTEASTKNAAPLVQKYAPKAAKLLEESAIAPFTKIMATEGALKGMAETKKGESLYMNAVKGALGGTAEGMYMHTLGVGAGEVSPALAKFISKSGLNSAVATAISTPLANAGVFATAKELRTLATEQRLATGEELAMEAGTGIGFSLLHLGSQYKNHKELNHYYDNTLQTNEANSLIRVLNETKGNLDLVYNPDLTPEKIADLEEARDELRAAILKEPDLAIKQQLGSEAIKIQNQLDAHDAINGVLDNKEDLIDWVNENNELTDKQKEFYTNKIAAIADTYDMSDFAVKKRELDAKINKAQEELNAAGEVFTNLKSPSDRVKAKLDVDNKRKELEDLNNQLTELITNKTKEDAVQEQATDEGVLRTEQPEVELPKVVEGNEQPEVVTTEKTITPEGEKEIAIEEPKTDEERKSLSSRIRSLKSDPNKTYDAILGIPVAIWDGSIELISKSIDAGVKVADAIKRGINYIEKNHRGRWDKKEFNDKVIASLSAKGIDIQKEELDVKKEKENAEIINGFYSPLEQGLLNSSTEKTTGKEWIKKLEGTTEGDELRFTGVQDFLSQNSDKSLTKQEVLDYMKNNRIEIKEVVKEKLTLLEESERDILKSELQLLGTKKTKALLRNDKESVKSIEKEEKILFEKLNTLTAKETKYRAYQLPGDKTNYKEVLITLPKKEGDKFKSSHYDEPNILAHIRMNTRIDSEGNKVLHIEEFQSDWGQKGKKEGFKKELTEEQKEFYKLRDLLYGEGEKMTQEQIDRYDYLYDKHADYLNKIKYGIVKTPEAPFVTKTADWTKLAWKVAIKEAVKQKADKITWTTGEQQNERYDLSKQVDGISYSRNEDGTYYVSGQKDGKSIFHKDNLKEKELEANIGKEVSQKIINGEGVKDTNKPGRKLLKGEDLKVGGAGMKGFYGSPKEGKLGIVGEVIKSLTGQDPKITKIDTKTIKLSSDAEKKMEEEGWTGGEPSKDNYTDQYSIDITPEIKESIELGASTFKGLSEAKSLADKIRAAKVGRGKAFDAILGIPVAIWDGSVELVAKTVEAGKSLKDAIKAGIKYIEANHKGKFDAKEYEREIKAGFIDGYEDTMKKMQDDIDIALGRKDTWENRVKELTDKLDAYKETDEYKEGDKRGKADKLKKAIEEAKQERDTSYESTINDAMKILKDSDMYKNATQIEQEELVRDVRERFELKEKKAPSPEKLLGEKPETITIKAKDAIKKQISDIAKGSREGAKAVKDAIKQIVDYVKTTKLNTGDLNKIMDVMSKSKIETEEGLNKAIDKIFDIVDKSDADLIEVSKKKIDKEKLKAELKAAKEKAKSINEAKKKIEDYLESVKDYGNLTRADQVKIRKEMMKVKDEKSLDKAVDKINDIIDNAKTDIIEMSEYKMLREMLLVAKETKGNIEERRKLIKAAIDNITKAGKVSSKQAGKLLNMINKVDLDSDVAVEKVIEYAEKIFNDAEYTEKLDKANGLKSELQKLSKSKDKNVHLKMLAKAFAQIKPSMVEDIDAHNEMASKIKEALKGSKIVGGEEMVKLAETVNINELNQYIKDSIEYQKERMTKDAMAEIKEKLDLDATEMTYDEMVELLNKDKVEEKDKEKIKEAKTIIKEYIKKLFKDKADTIKEIFDTGKNPLTGEDLSIDKLKKEAVKRFMNMELDLLSAKEILNARDALNNFIENGSTAGMDRISSALEGIKDAKGIVDENNTKRTDKGKLIAKDLRVYFNKPIGRTMAEQMSSLPLLLDWMFRGQRAGTKFSEKSGLSPLINQKSYVQNIMNQTAEDYVKEFFKKRANGKVFNSSENNIERGMIADLKRRRVGSEEDAKTEFGVNKGLIEQSIDALKNGSKEERKLAEKYKTVYDKILKGSENIEDVVKKSDKENVKAVDWWIEKWAEIYDELADVSENVYNEAMDRELDYTTKKFSYLSDAKTPDALDPNESLYHGNNNNGLYKKKTGVLEKRQYADELKKNDNGDPLMYRDLSFDKSNINAMYDALMDIHTAKSIRQVEGFFKSKYIKDIIPNKDDRDILFNADGTGRVQEFVRNIRNKQIVDQSQMSKSLRALNSSARLGVSSVLATAAQPFKQTIPAAVHALVNGANILGHLDIAFNKDKQNFLKNSGYGIGLRGSESLAGISTVNRMIEEEQTPTYEKVIGLVDQAAKIQLKLLLESPDKGVAKASWLAFYEKGLRRQGEKTSNIDYSTHKLNKEAADYAQKMVDRQQNISDKDLQGSFFNSKDPFKQVVGKIMMPFATFRMNQTIRMMSDIATLKNKMSTIEDRKSAFRSLVGYGSEMAIFRLLSGAATYYTGSLTKALMGQDETEEEKDKRINSAIKAQVTGTIPDIFSPIPTAAMDYAVTKGADKLIDLFQNYALGMEEEDRKHLYVNDKMDMLKSLGIFGITIEKASDLLDLRELISTGHFKDEYGRDKYISQPDREALRSMGVLSFLSNSHILPADGNNMSKNAIKYAKKNASTKEGGKSEEDIYNDAEQKYESEQNKQEAEQVKSDKVDVLEKLLKSSGNPKKKAAIRDMIYELSKTKEDEEYDRKARKEEIMQEKQEMDELLEGYDNKEDMKRYAPDKYEKNFGENSDYYKRHRYEMEIEKKLNQLLREKKDKENRYIKGEKKSKKSWSYGGSSSYTKTVRDEQGNIISTYKKNKKW